MLKWEEQPFKRKEELVKLKKIVVITIAFMVKWKSNFALYEQKKGYVTVIS